jgi:hypothetical protein
VVGKLAVVAAGLIGGLSQPAAASATPACASAPAQSSSAVSCPQQRLDYAQVWPLTQGQHVTVAVVDSGVDGRQRQLAGRVEVSFAAVMASAHATTDPRTGAKATTSPPGPTAAPLTSRLTMGGG